MSVTQKDDDINNAIQLNQSLVFDYSASEVSEEGEEREEDTFDYIHTTESAAQDCVIASDKFRKFS